jgi:type IV pilus assembly protein PilV
MKKPPKISMKFQSVPKQQGFMLLEALIAILIFSFGILAIAGLQGAMMKNTEDATFRAEAAYIVQQNIGGLLANPLAIGANTKTAVPSLPNGFLYINSISNGRLRFRVTWQSQGVDVGNTGWQNANEPVHTYEAITSIFTAR